MPVGHDILLVYPDNNLDKSSGSAPFSWLVLNTEIESQTYQISSICCWSICNRLWSCRGSGSIWRNRVLTGYVPLHKDRIVDCFFQFEAWIGQRKWKTCGQLSAFRVPESRMKLDIVLLVGDAGGNMLRRKESRAGKPRLLNRQLRLTTVNTFLVCC